MKKMNGYAVNCTPPISSLQDLWNITYLDSIPVQSPQVAEMPAQKKGKPMCYDCDCEESTVENRKLTYAQNRVTSLSYDKRTELRKMFRLDETAPQTGEELVDIIKNGKYTLLTSAEMQTQNRYAYSSLSYFRWFTPETKPDQAGYEIAAKELDKIVGDTTDLVSLSDAAAQIAALKTLSDWQPSNKPA